MGALRSIVLGPLEATMFEVKWVGQLDPLRAA